MNNTFSTSILHEAVGYIQDNAILGIKNPHNPTFVKLWGSIYYGSQIAAVEISYIEFTEKLFHERVV